MTNLSLSSKAKTLEELNSVITRAKILPLIRFFTFKYYNNKDEIIDSIQNKFNKNIIVRSSSINEDNLNTSNAGGFDSIIDVNINSKVEIEKAIKKVIVSYGNNINSEDEIFVQPMLNNVSMSGVIFSADIDTLSSYYIINYDESGSTDSVTSGNTNNLKNLVLFKKFNNFKNKKINNLVKATKECENIFNNNFLDIEFAFVGDDLFILQVRAIVTIGKDNLSNLDLSKSLHKLHNKIKKLNSPHPNLLGDRTIFGVMPDWNPAEIIGIRPKRLAISLYKELITDETWAYQRDNYGYRNLRSHPLLISFLGVPYIDVRISFNSFIPKKINEKIAIKLINHYLNELAKNTKYHDKVEFEIIYSCYYFGINKKLSLLLKKGFNNYEIKQLQVALLNLTNKIIDPKNGLYRKDLEKVKILQDKFIGIVNSKLSLIDKIYWLVKDVKRYGTLPFAGIARAGFIAMQFLNSFVDEKIISKKEYDLFLNNLNTISKQLSNDFNSLAKDEFLTKYGHLRPGTYDILSLRYDEAYELYFGSQKSEVLKSEIKFKFTDKQKNKIDKLIKKNGLKTDYKSLIYFIKEAIEGREYSKFVFTMHLSQILKYIEEFGNKFGFSKDELAYLDIQSILNLYSTLDHRDVVDIFKFDINKNKEFYEFTKAVKLPSLIINPDDIYKFYLEEGEPNFITLKIINSQVLNEDNLYKKSLKGKIICIKSGDPGYDYLFSKDIGGLITCYGGANSHMAIRCAELGIPAVIGCGEYLYSKYSNATTLVINALNKQIKVIK